MQSCIRNNYTRINNYNKKKHRRQLVQWVRKWIHRRDAYGTSNNLLKELAIEDPKRYHTHLRMNEELFFF